VPAATAGVFDALVDAVYALCPEADRVTDSNQSGLSTPITEDTVRTWLLDVSAFVDARLGRWHELTGATLTRITSAARTVVTDGAASYLEAARYPTRASLNDSTYAGVLWDRYQTGLLALQADVTELFDDPGADGDVAASTSGPYGAFPPTYFADGMWW
jgi:hypothetical protein